MPTLIVSSALMQINLSHYAGSTALEISAISAANSNAAARDPRSASKAEKKRLVSHEAI